MAAVLPWVPYRRDSPALGLVSAGISTAVHGRLRVQLTMGADQPADRRARWRPVPLSMFSPHGIIIALEDVG